MRIYVLITGLIYGIITVLHAWRVIQEGTGKLHDPWFLGFTILSVVMALWAWLILRARSKA